MMLRVATLALVAALVVTFWPTLRNAAAHLAAGGSSTPIGGTMQERMRATISTAASDALRRVRPNVTHLPDLDRWLSDTAAAYLAGRVSLEQAAVLKPELPDAYLRDYRPAWVTVQGVAGLPLADPAKFGRDAVRDRSAPELGSGSHYGIGAAVSARGDRAVVIVATATPSARLYRIPERPSALTPRGGEATSVVGVADPARNAEITRFLADVEAEVFAIANDYRRANGLPPLRPEAELDRAARRHGIDMARRNFFDHTNPDGLGPHDRIARDTAWRDLTASAENITMHGGAVGYLAAGPAYAARTMMDGWIHSEGHRRNLLTPNVTLLGVGVTFDGPDDTLYGTQKFARRGW